MTRSGRGPQSKTESETNGQRSSDGYRGRGTRVEKRTHRANGPCNGKRRDTRPSPKDTAPTMGSQGEEEGGAVP